MLKVRQKSLLVPAVLVTWFCVSAAEAHRQYDPGLRRFAQRDPLSSRSIGGGGFHDGMSLHSALACNPVNRSDPGGLKCQPSVKPQGTYGGLDSPDCGLAACRNAIALDPPVAYGCDKCIFVSPSCTHVRYHCYTYDDGLDPVCDCLCVFESGSCCSGGAVCAI
jgi:RHS repeat-associated protein